MQLAKRLKLHRWSPLRSPRASLPFSSPPNARRKEFLHSIFSRPRSAVSPARGGQQHSHRGTPGSLTQVLFQMSFKFLQAPQPPPHPTPAASRSDHFPPPLSPEKEDRGDKVSFLSFPPLFTPSNPACSTSSLPPGFVLRVPALKRLPGSDQGLGSFSSTTVPGSRRTLLPHVRAAS